MISVGEASAQTPFPSMKLGRTILVLSIVWLAVITASHGVLNLRWLAKKSAGGPEQLFGVGFLPVTCHLTCPVTDFINKNTRKAA